VLADGAGGAAGAPVSTGAAGAWAPGLAAGAQQLGAGAQQLGAGAQDDWQQDDFRLQHPAANVTSEQRANPAEHKKAVAANFNIKSLLLQGRRSGKRPNAWPDQNRLKRA
jgi:hypothetical protein